MKILYVEDEIAHVELTQRTLDENIHDEFTLFHAGTIRDALDLLDAEPDIDLVLSDLRLPDGSGLDLLKKVRERQSPPAVVLVTGQGDQEVAVAALKAGAADYLVKQSDYLHRLPVVISNAVAQNRLLREQAALREAEIKYQSLVEQISAVVFIDDIDEEETTLYMSPRIEELTGYTSDEWRADPDIWINSVHPDDRERITEAEAGTHKKGMRFQEEYRMIRRDGKVAWIKEDTNLIRDKDGKPLYWQGILLDVTEEQERAQREASLLDLMRVSVASLDLETVMQSILGHMVNLIPSDTGTIQLLEGDNLRIAAYIGSEESKLILGKNLSHSGFPLNFKAIEEKRPVRVDDTNKNSDYVKVEGYKSARSFLAIPMVFKGEAIGIAALDSQQPNRYTLEDEEFALAIANHAAIALANARLFESEQQRRQEAENLRQAATAISSTLDLDAVVKEILAALRQVIPYDSGSVFLHEGDKLRMAMTQGYPHSERLKNLTFPADDDFFQLIQNTGQPIIVQDAQKDARFKNWGDSYYVRGWIVIPLVSRGRVIGGITLDSLQPGVFDETTGKTAMAFAHQAAAAIDNARLYDETQRRLSEMETINRLSTSLRTTQSIDKMLEFLLNETLHLIQTAHGAIWLYDAAEEKLVQRVARGGPVNFKNKAIKTSAVSIISHTFLSGNAYISVEFISDPLANKENLEITPPGMGGAGIPIQSTAGTIGVLMIGMEKGRQIGDQINLLTTLAEIAGNSIHRAQLFEHNREQIQRLTTLRDIDTAIASSFDLRLTLNILMDQTIKHLGVNAVDIILYHPDLQSITYLSSSGFQSPSPTRPQMRIGEGLTGQVIIRQKTFHITDLQNSPEIKNEPLLRREGFVTYIGIPLIVKGQIKGVFEVFHRAPLLPTPDWMEFLHTLAGQAAIAIDNSQLFENLQRSNQELIQAYDTTLEGWARALELRDRETEGHTRRVTELTLRLAKYMGTSENEMVNIHRGVLLHDIGKMGVPDNILKKTGQLTEGEWGEMRQHPTYAYNLLSPISYLRAALDIPYCHHEHWDGSGYPRGLKGEQIPLSARIFSVVDIWDALLSDRPYRKRWPQDKVIEYLKEIAGSHLDAMVVEVFLSMIAEDESNAE